MTGLPIPAELLCEHLQALDALARRLVGDRHAAEDAVQETLVTALSDAPPRCGRLASWLAMVLRNRVRQDARAGSRRRLRERARTRPGPSPAAADVAGELELHRRLLELVHALPAAARQALFLRFWRGLTPAEIATLIGVPEKTVHARIARALARLRAAIDGRRVRGAFLGAFCGWRSAPVTNVVTTGAVTTGVGMLMKTKLLAAAAVVVAVIATLPLLDPTPATDVQPVTPLLAPNSVVAAVDGGERDLDAVAERTAVPGDRGLAAEPGPAPAPAPWVEGSVQRLDGSPVAGVEVVFERMRGSALPSRDPEVPPMTSDRDGRFGLAWPARAGWLTIADGRWAIVRRAWCGIEAPSEPPVVLVSAARRYGGRVLDPDGAPVVGATVTLSIGDSLAPSRVAGGAVVALPNDLGNVTTDARGLFVFPSVGWIAGAKMVAECAPFGDATCELPSVDTLDLLLQLAPPPDDPRVHGIVLDAGGQPAVGAFVAVGGDSVRTAADGRFAVPWNFGRRPDWVRAVLPGVGSVTERLRPGAGQPGWHPDQPITLQLPSKPLAVRGRVVDHEGAPVAGAHVWTPDLTWLGNVTVEHQGHQLSSPSSVEGVTLDPNSGIDAITELGTETDADGRFELRGLTARPYAFFAMVATTLAAAGPVTASPGETIELRLERGTLRPVAGRLVSDVDGAALAGVRIAFGRRLPWQRPSRELDPWAGSPMLAAGAGHAFRDVTVATDADGRFTLPALVVAGAYLTFEGEAVFLAPPYDLAADQPLEDLRVALPARSTFRLLLEQPGEADTFSLERVGGGQQPLFVRVEGSVISAWRVELVEGRAPPAYTRAGEAIVVLQRGGQEVRRTRVTLPTGEHDLRL